MKLSRIANLAICFFLLLPSLSIAAEPPKGFRTFIWGASADSTLKKITGPTDDGTTLYKPQAIKQPGLLLDIPVAEETYIFTKGKFYAGSAFIDGRENFDKRKITLTKTFGAPTFSNDRIELFKWKWPNSKVEVHLSFQTKFARTTVTYMNKEI
jgi:hypothetical protein